MKRSCCGIVTVFALSLLVTTGSSAHAQNPQLKPTHQNVAYDDQHDVQKLDVYLAESDSPVPAMVHIHGGGWIMGSKNKIPGWLSAGVRGGDFSVVSIEYRFTNVAPHPTQVNDCVRAIQFVRHKADEWNIDPARIGVTGGSAGGHLSLWVAVHDDAARPDEDDPVERQSSRVSCAVSFAGPTDWSLLSEIDHKHPAYRQLLGNEPGTPVDEMDKDALHDVSPVSFVSDDDPPIMQVHGTSDNVVPFEHATRMDARLKKAGVRSELVVIDGGNHGVAGGGPQVSVRAIEFVNQLFLSP